MDSPGGIVLNTIFLGTPRHLLCMAPAEVAVVEPLRLD